MGVVVDSVVVETGVVASVLLGAEAHHRSVCASAVSIMPTVISSLPPVAGAVVVVASGVVIVLPTMVILSAVDEADVSLVLIVVGVATAVLMGAGVHHMSC